MGEEMGGKKVGELKLRGRCSQALELAEKAREASFWWLEADRGVGSRPHIRGVTRMGNNWRFDSPAYADLT